MDLNVYTAVKDYVVNKSYRPQTNGLTGTLLVCIYSSDLVAMLSSGRACIDWTQCLEEILVGMREGPNTARSHTIPWIQYPRRRTWRWYCQTLISVWATYHYDEVVDSNAILCPCTPLLGRIRLALVCNQWIDLLNIFLPYLVFHHRQLLVGINPHTVPIFYNFKCVLWPLILSFGLDSLLSVI